MYTCVDYQIHTAQISLDSTTCKRTIEKNTNAELLKVKAIYCEGGFGKALGGGGGKFMGGMPGSDPGGGCGGGAAKKMLVTQHEVKKTVVSG